ncbi:shikimate kinase [Priestia koreensis]|uniref:shikimate kinase n=1 Tax=Priestia koreensis TaxID=284581 RepID=UPI001F582BDD|nr:shikimate kinase [Priestia koreensis]UNL84174.1 shikimate kinase [Priestia koreensis]
MKSVYIVGFMGAGKTTISDALKAKLQCQVVDVDQYIVEKEGRTIAEIFERDGEAFFRNLEHRYLKEIPTEDVIVSTGGGMFAEERNRTFIKENGISIYLHADWNEIRSRIQGDTGRPLVQEHSLDGLQSLLEKRRPFYDQADFTVDTTGRTVEDICTEVLGLIN